MPKRSTSDASGQRGAELNFGIGDELIEQREDNPNKHKCACLKDQAANDGPGLQKSTGGLKISAPRQAESDGDQQRAQGDRHPKARHAHEPMASTFHAPDVVERAFDAVKHGEGDEDKEGHASDTERAAASIVDKFVDALGDEFLGSDTGISRRHRGHDGIGARRTLLIGGWRGRWRGDRGWGDDVGNEFVYGLVNFLFTFLSEQTAGDADGDCEQRNERQQRRVGQGGSANEATVLDKAFADEKPKMDEMLEAPGQADFIFLAGGDSNKTRERALWHERI